MQFLKNHAIKIFLIVPILLSFVSSYHLITLFSLGNPMWLAIILAITFELGAIFSFIAVSPGFLYKLKKNIILSVFMIIVMLQILGNVYATYDYAMNKIEQQPEHLDNLLGLFMNMFDKGMIGIILSFVLGITIPICALLIFKGTINYVEEEMDDRHTMDFYKSYKYNVKTDIGRSEQDLQQIADSFKENLKPQDSEYIEKTNEVEQQESQENNEVEQNEEDEEYKDPAEIINEAQNKNKNKNQNKKNLTQGSVTSDEFIDEEKD